MAGKFQNINFELDNIPTMPVVAAQMIEMIDSANTSAAQLAKVVAKDAAVSARVLKIANSSFYSMSRQVTTLSTAIVVLGERTLKNLVLAASLRGIHQTFGIIEQMLWEDSMVCALASRFLAQRLALADPEEAFMAGLFRHIGKVVLNSQDKNFKRRTKELLKSGCLIMGEQEREHFGVTHAEIGAAVLERWQLSERLCQVALHHDDVDLAGIEDQAISNLICLVNIASQFPAILGIYGVRQEVDLSEQPGAKILQLGAEQLTDLQDEFCCIFEENRQEFLA